MQAVIVAIIGAAVGLGGAALLVPALFALDPSNAFTADAVSVDWRVAIAAVLSAAAIMIVAVVGPVLRFAGPKIASDLTSGSRRPIGGRSSARTRTRAGRRANRHGARAAVVERTDCHGRCCRPPRSIPDSTRRVW